MLTEVEVKQAKAKEKPHRLSDQGGLYLEVSPIGSKYWRYKYRISTGAQRIEKRLALGVYPEISLKNARELHREAHALVSQGGDPSLEKREQKAFAEVASLNTFGGFVRDACSARICSPSTSEQSTKLLRLISLACSE